MLPEVGSGTGEIGSLANALAGVSQPLDRLLKFYGSIDPDTPRFVKTLKMRAMYETSHGAHDHQQKSPGFSDAAFKPAEKISLTGLWEAIATDYVEYDIQMFGIGLLEYYALPIYQRQGLNTAALRTTATRLKAKEDELAYLAKTEAARPKSNQSEEDIKLQEALSNARGL